MTSHVNKQLSQLAALTSREKQHMTIFSADRINVIFYYVTVPGLV